MPLKRLAPAKQRRLTALMGKNNSGTITATERAELRRLAREAESIALENAKRLTDRR